jgi:glucosamine-6-phosphate deaminase
MSAHVVQRYAAPLAEAAIDVVYLGIGQNGHLAFNVLPVADLSDPVAVKVVELDDDCRRQQVEDGCFPAALRTDARLHLDRSSAPGSRVTAMSDGT